MQRRPTGRSGMLGDLILPTQGGQEGLWCQWQCDAGGPLCTVYSLARYTGTAHHSDGKLARMQECIRGKGGQRFR